RLPCPPRPDRTLSRPPPTAPTPARKCPRRRSLPPRSPPCPATRCRKSWAAAAWGPSTWPGSCRRAASSPSRCSVRAPSPAPAGPCQPARSRAEAEALSSMEHPNFLMVHEVGQHQGRPYLALQFADGGNLAHLLARRLPTPHETAQLVEILAWAMHYAHARGI